MRGVMAVDIKRGIAFGISMVLCLKQGFVKTLRFFTHLGQDVVRGSIYYAKYSIEVICDKTFPKGFYDWNATADRCLKVQIGIGLSCGTKELFSGVRKECLICSYYVFSA